MRRRASWALLAALLSGACGTTVPAATRAISTQPSDSTGSGTGLTTGGLATSTSGTTGTASTGGASGTTGGTGTPGTTGSPTSGGTAAGPTGSVTGTAGGSAASIPPTGQGWDQKNVYLGLMLASDAEKALSTAGINLNPGDTAGDARAIQDALNQRGGVFGRKVVVLVHDNASASIQANPAGAASENCTYFTQDHKVLGVINTVSVLDLAELRSCLASHHTPLFTLSTQPFDDKVEHTTAPYFYNGISVSWSPLIPLLVQRLQSQQWLTPWDARTGGPTTVGKAKIGILYGNDDAGNRVGPLLAAQFKAAGYDTVTFQWTQTQDAAAAVLRFAQNGVTHVVSIDNFLFFFATAAGSQAYYPRYAVNTYNGIQVLLEAQVPKRQLAGAKGVGWVPSLDVDSQQGASFKGPATDQCLRDLAAGGQSFAGKRFAESVGLGVCDGVRLPILSAVAGGGLDPDAIRRGVIALGTGFPIADGTRSGLSPTQFGLPGELRDIGFDSTCGCFKYTSKGYPL